MPVYFLTQYELDERRWRRSQALARVALFVAKGLGLAFAVWIVAVLWFAL